MKFRNNRELERFLLREVHGRDLPPPTRKPPAKEKRGPARDSDYRAWIRTLPCCACGSNPPSEPAHTGTDGGGSQKSSDYSCIPLCAACHRAGPHAYHGLNSSAAAFASRYGLDYARLAARLHAEWRARQRGAA